MKRLNLITASAYLIYAFLYLPLVVMVTFSFNDSRLNAEWVGFTFSWYEVLFSDPDMLSAAGNSLIIAAISALISTVLGTLAGIAMFKFRPKILSALVLAPIAMPDILMGVSLLIWFILLNMSLGIKSIVLAHVTFCIGFVAISVQARMAQMEQSLVEAARDLGATPLQAFTRITLPLLAPGILAGGLLAFTLSLDDFVITFFTSGVESSTLPLQIYSMVKTAVTPEVNAVSTLLMVLTLFIIMVVSKLSPSLLSNR